MKPAVAVMLLPAILLLAIACEAPASPIVAPDSTSVFVSPPPGAEKATVRSVIDGDTIKIVLNGREYKLRYIGMDTPELQPPNRGTDCYAREAAQANKRLIDGKTITLERDVSETDRFDRLLRYVYLDGMMVNEVLVRERYAHVSTFPPDVRYAERLRAAEEEARRAGRGLWSTCRRVQ